MFIHYILLLLCSKQFCCFCGLLQRLFGEYLLSSVFKIDSVTGKCEIFSRNEGKHVKTAKNFHRKTKAIHVTVLHNGKQYI